MYPEQVYKRESDGKMVRRLTQKQIDKVQQFNQTNATMGRYEIDLRGALDAIEVVAEDDPNADMITIRFAGMTVGILPDGSAHS